MCTVMPQQSNNNTIDIDAWAQVDGASFTAQPLVFIRFQGCNPGVVGTLFIEVAVSI